MKKAKYKVGDKVKIRADLKLHGRYGTDVCVSDMLPYTEQKATIVRVDPYNEGFEYYIDLDQGVWTWTEEMFEGEVG